MKYLLIIILCSLCTLGVHAQLPSSTFPSRIFTGNTKAQWTILDSPLVNPILDTFYARYAGTQIVRIQGGDTSFWFSGGNRRWFKNLNWRDTLTNLATQYDLSLLPQVNTNIANSSLIANGNYTQNWAGNNLIFNSIKGLFFNTTGSLSGRTKSGRIYSDPGDFDDIPFMILLKTSKNGLPSSDSLRNFFREVSGQLEIRATNFITNKQSGLVMSQNGIAMTAFGSGLVSSRTVSIDTSGIYIAGADPSASADSIYALGPYDPINGTNKLLKIKLPSGGADTTSLSNRINLKATVYNILQYGAVGDGRRLFDAAMTASSNVLTSATAGFALTDVGKSIRVNSAGAAGIDLITTISGFTNSTTITLTASASSTVSADTVVFGTDNTEFIQNTLDTCYVHGGGTVYIPNGVYVISDTLRTSVLGVNPNSQIVLPMSYNAGTGINAVENRTAILLEGETGPEFSPNGPLSDIIPSLKGSVIYSIINGTGNAPAVIASKAPFQLITGDSINYNYFGFKNITILTPANRNEGGTSIGGINMYFGTPFLYQNLLITADGKGKTSVRPTNNVAGLIANKINSETMAVLERVDVRLYKYGICVSDHANMDQCEVFLCDKAFVMFNNFGAIQGNRIMPVWNIVGIYKPNTNIMGLPLTGGGGSYFNIDMLHSEVYDGDAAPGWWNYTYILEDSGNLAHGAMTYNIVKAGVGIDNTLFNKYGGDMFNCTQIDKPSWFISGDDINTLNTGNTVINSANLNINSTTTIDSHGFYVTNANAAFGANSATFPLTRTGILVKAQNTDGAEIILQPSSAGASSGTALVVSGNDGSLINRLSGSLYFGSNGNSTAAILSSGNFGIGTLTPDATLQVDGNLHTTTGTVTINGNNTNQVTVSGSNAARISLYVRNTNSGGNGSVYFDNDRGSFSAYGGFLTGGSTDGSGNLFGVTRADKTFLIHDGANGLGLGIGTLNNQSFILGTNNTNRINIAGSGAITFNSAYTFTTVDGTSGQVLTTNGSGAVSFQTPSSATTLYSGDGTLAGDRTVTGSGSDLTLASIDRFRINYNSLVQSKNDGTIPYTTIITGAGNVWEIGYTPTPAVFSKGSGIIIDTNNNVSLGSTLIPSTAPLYATGGSAYINGMQSALGNFYRVTNVTADITASIQQYFFAIDATLGNITVTLPAASTAFGSGMGIQYVFKRLDNSGNTISVVRAGADTIDGATSFSLAAQYESRELQCTSSSVWSIK